MGKQDAEPESIDFTKLLGFETLTSELDAELDFQNETIGAKLGAKVGGGVEATGPAKY